MALTVTPIDVRGGDREELAAFLARNHFPFHVQPHTGAADPGRRIDSGSFDGPGLASLWLDDAQDGRVGMVTLSDLDGPAPMLDLRLDERARGRGMGATALRAITRHVFDTYPRATRFEGETREDNLAMRQTFVRCGFVKEAHYRETWDVPGGAPRAGVVYAILRRDWELGVITPVRFNDLGF